MVADCETILSELQKQGALGYQLLMEPTGCVVVTPYTQPDLAAVELVIEDTSTGYKLSDQGDTIGVLFSQGLTITPAIKADLKAIAASYGVEFDGAAFVAFADQNHIGHIADRLARAIQAASFLIYKRAHRIPAHFEDDVENYLIKKRVTYHLNYPIRGYTTSHEITFFIDKNRNILLEPLSASSPTAAKSKAERLSFKWQDLRRANVPGRFVTLIDDTGQKWETIWNAPKNDALRILSGYSDEVVRWVADREHLDHLIVLA
ncbi:MAG: DUF1828 domain-containing protein [Caldilineales bacterium]|nr:DUF1828 domain-containing protein [Caldilineales bacterium]